MSRSAILLLSLVLTGCGTTRTLDGHDIEDVWLAAKEVMLERDAATMFDGAKRTGTSENREEPWYLDLVRWFSLGSFGTTGQQMRVELVENGGRVDARVSASHDFIAAWLPISFPRRGLERDVLGQIEARLAQRKPLGKVAAQLDGFGGAPVQVEGVWDEQRNRERLFARRIADGQRSAKGPRRTDPVVKPVTPEKPIDPAPSGMIAISGGEYEMGEAGGEVDARPVHKVRVDPFYLDRREVTNAQYRKFNDWYTRTKDQRYDHPDQPASKKDHTPATWKSKEYRRFNGADQPVVGIDWYDAYAYSRWAGKRLPTEAEWEAAARGSLGRKFPWGGHFAPRLANTWESGLRRSLPVGSFPGGKTPEGAEDMGGNVWEWCYDWYDPKSYQGRQKENPQGPAVGKDKVIRGGSWAHPAKMARATYRNFGRPVVWSYYIGFRCAKSARQR